jgi:hypothetical protein
VPRISREYERFAFAREIKRGVLSEVAECIRAGALPAGADPTAVLRTIHAGLIGVAVLRLTERLAADEDADKIAANVLDVTIAGLQSGVALQPISKSGCPLDEAAATDEDAAGQVVRSRSRR